ncbi:MAG: PHP domain-containing protein, partial [Gammaproteobacteria bacterium]|nr:PHP domain-containing protein [Gammaproteobacteria bacterium]
MTRFVHLSIHTEYSLVDSIVRVGPLVAAAQAARMPAVAITDQNSVAAMVKLYRAAVTAGIKPILGADVCVADADGDGHSRLILLCRNTAGFRALSRLLTRSGIEGRSSGRPMLARSWLEAEDLDGLIALSGGLHGELGRLLSSDQHEQARSALRTWMGLFPGRYYIELQRLGWPQESAYI